MTDQNQPAEDRYFTCMVGDCNYAARTLDYFDETHLTYVETRNPDGTWERAAAYRSYDRAASTARALGRDHRHATPDPVASPTKYGHWTVQDGFGVLCEIRLGADRDLPYEVRRPGGSGALVSLHPTLEAAAAEIRSWG